MAELRELFFESAQELMQALNDEALKLEKHPGDPEIVRSIRRTVHTLKGDAAACGYRELSEVAHELEDALALESAAGHTILAEVAFTAADLFTAMLAAYRKRSKLPSRDPLRKMVKKLTDDPATKRGRKKAAVTAKALGWTEYEKLAAQKAQSDGNSVYHVLAQIDPHCAMPIAGRHLVQNALAGMGEVLAARPDAGSPAATKQIEFLVATEQTGAEVSAKCRIPTIVASVKVDLLPGEVASTVKRAPKRTAKTVPNEQAMSAPAEPGVEEPTTGPAEEPESASESTVQPHATLAENILRVDSERIDSVLNLVGELIIGKSMLQQALNEFAKFYPKEALRGKFADAMAFQARVLNDLQRSVMKIRMVPVEQLFRRFPRMVRDVALQCGKDVELVVSGQDTDLDKSIL